MTSSLAALVCGSTDVRHRLNAKYAAIVVRHAFTNLKFAFELDIAEVIAFHRL
jgi:hypothetical protein